MSGYIGSKTSVTQVDGYNRTEADAEFVQDPNGAITVSGSNVGIGTSSPSGAKLQVTGSNYNDQLVIDRTDTSSKWGLAGADSGGFQIYDVNSSNATRMTIDSSGNVGVGATPLTSGNIPNLTIANTAHGLGLGFQGATLPTAAGIYTSSSANFGQAYGSVVVQSRTDYSGYSISFRNNGGERMRINSDGGIDLGAANSGGISMLPSWSGGAALLYWNRVDTTAVTTALRFDNQGVARGTITYNNSSTSYNTSSDYRLKTDAQPMTGASARVQALNPVNFEWIVDGTRVDGFLAHEAQAVVPEAVSGTQDGMRDEKYEVTAAVEATFDDDGNELTAPVDAVMGTRSVPDYQGIDQSKLVPLLTAALQEALTKIDDMETRLAALEAV
jgi:hypothetical protein